MKSDESLTWPISNNCLSHVPAAVPDTQLSCFLSHMTLVSLALDIRRVLAWAPESVSDQYGGNVVSSVVSGPGLPGSQLR